MEAGAITSSVQRFDATTFRLIVASLISAKGLRPLARQWGVKESTLRSFLEGRDVGMSRVEAVAEAMGQPLYMGRPPALDPGSVGTLDGQDYATLPRYDVEVSAGPGAAVADPEPMARVAFRRSWLSRMGVGTDRASIVTVRGESMAPHLRDGDVVLIDGNRIEPRDRKVFAFIDTNDDLRIKRLETLGDTLYLLSDNPDCPTEIRVGAEQKEMRVLGQVVWSARTWR